MHNQVFLPIHHLSLALMFTRLVKQITMQTAFYLLTKMSMEMVILLTTIPMVMGSPTLPDIDDDGDGVYTINEYDTDGDGTQMTPMVTVFQSYLRQRIS